MDILHIQNNLYLCFVINYINLIKNNQNYHLLMNEYINLHIIYKINFVLNLNYIYLLF